MIPLKLQLKNFLSYGNNLQTVDFAPYKLICLSGRNGHGKSALLDAITWALWGQARKVGATSKPDDGILRLGQTEMTVCFDFIFNGQTYRVRRDYSKKYGKPHTHVDFGLLDNDNNRFIPLTDKTIRKTQLKIESILGLDYESFINSSFLRQGQANEFSKKSAKERKEVLATILGLHHYERARSLTLEKIRTLNNEQLHIEKLKERLIQEQEKIKEVPYQLATLDRDLKKILDEETQATQLIKTIAEKKKECLNKRHKEKLLSFELTQLKEQETEKRISLKKIRIEWQGFHEKFISSTDQEKLKHEKQKIVHEISTLQKNVQKNLDERSEYLKIKEKKAVLEGQVIRSFEKEYQELFSSIERLAAQHEFLKNTLIKQIETKKEYSEQIKISETAIATIRQNLPPETLLMESFELKKKLEREREFYQRWIEQGNWVNSELKNIAQKQILSQDPTNPSCPLCEQNLSQARKRFLHKKFSTDTDFLEHRFKRLSALIKRLRESLQKQHQELESVLKIESLLKEQDSITKDLRKLEESIASTEKELKTIAKHLETLKDQEKTLQQKQITSLKNNHELNELEIKIKNFENSNYASEDPIKKIPLLTETLHRIEEKLELFEKIKEQKAAQEERRKTISQLCCDLKKIQSIKKQLEETIKPFATLNQEEISLEKKELEAHNLLKSILQNKEEQLTEKGRLETEKKKGEQLTKEQKELENNSALLGTSIHEYQIISKALSKDGIQALLIEDALPEIESEANNLLARLTDNQASIHIESLRDLKKGGTRETLDINISDASGIRPYELFSGGEAFRIDFALRIAISKLLAHRAGTSLQTLIIDEGFGSQDEDGLYKIMDALYLIQDDFEKIIIVSHLSTMKDQFPVHFLIEKQAQGSTVHVIEQG